MDVRTFKLLCWSDKCGSLKYVGFLVKYWIDEFHTSVWRQVVQKHTRHTSVFGKLVQLYHVMNKISTFGNDPTVIVYKSVVRSVMMCVSATREPCRRDARQRAAGNWQRRSGGGYRFVSTPVQFRLGQAGMPLIVCHVMALSVAKPCKLSGTGNRAVRQLSASLIPPVICWQQKIQTEILCKCQVKVFTCPRREGIKGEQRYSSAHS